MSLSSTAFHNPHFYYDSDNNLLSVNNVEPFVNGEINEDINACKNCFGCPLINIIRDKYEYKNFDGLPLGTGCAEFMSKKIIYKNKNEKIKINIDRTEYIIDGRIVSKSTRTKKSFRIFTNIDKSIEYIHKLIEKTRLNNKQKISIVTSATDKTLKNIDLRINKIDVPVNVSRGKVIVCI